MNEDAMQKLVDTLKLDDGILGGKHVVKGKQLLTGDDGAYIMPEGYRYCEECDAFTPHEPEEGALFQRLGCVVCGDSSSDFGDSCPNCGWCEDGSDGPLFMDVAVHGDGCHYKPFHVEEENCQGLEYEREYVWAEEVSRQFENTLRVRAYFLGFRAHKDPILRRFEEMRKMKCGCPRHRIYPSTHVRRYSSRSVVSYDCMNADVLCPKCGCEFSVYEWTYSDGNC